VLYVNIYNDGAIASKYKGVVYLFCTEPCHFESSLSNCLPSIAKDDKREGEQYDLSWVISRRAVLGWREIMNLAEGEERRVGNTPHPRLEFHGSYYSVDC
jgi:hypothetical protein